VLNIGKLDSGKAQYYLDSVAQGVEDYYLHAGEAPGVWRGAAAEELGLGGEVEAEQLLAVLAGVHPGTGERLAFSQRGGERVPGFDLTFRAPKSVSLLYSLGSPEVREQVRLAHEASVTVGLGYLEREAGFGRRRVDGKIVDVPTSGFVAAGFQHRTSRAGDPLLHHHVLIANLVKGSDGKWGAVDARLIYAHAKTAGFLQEAELRAQLTQRLGVEWQAVRNGTCDIEGFSREVILGFSRRRVEILARMAERGESSAAAAQVATLDTRRAKDYGVNPEGLLPEWRRRAQSLGLTAEVLEGTMRRPAAWEGSQVRLQEALQRAELELGGERGLTAQASTFSRRDVVQALCERLPGADAVLVESAADSFLASPEVVRLGASESSLRSVDVIRLGGGRVIAAAPDERRYSTQELLDTEFRLVTEAKARNTVARSRPVATVTEAAFDRALAGRPSLSPEQNGMVWELTKHGRAVELVQGRAGAGKTYALDACREAWQASGFTVIGCSLSAQAAAELQAGSGIPSCTIDRLLLDLGADSSVRLLPKGRSVVVVDEAGMVGTRLLSRLMERADSRGAKVVLVGDDRQLPEVDAGGAFRGLRKELGAVELKDNRRQVEEWEREALVDIREGRSGEAIRAYVSHGRVVVGDSAEAVRGKLVEDWWAARQQAAPGGGGDSIMVALRRSDVRDLNERARALRESAGELVGPALQLTSGAFSEGDEVVTGRNDRHLGVRNGTRGVVEAVDVDSGELVIRTAPIRGEEGRAVVLPKGYLDAGHLSHSYAVTGHKAQGMTTDWAFVLGDDSLYREWGYVALSRGRVENRLYVVGDARVSDADIREALHGRSALPEQKSALDDLERALSWSHSQEMATEVAKTLAGAPDEVRDALRGFSQEQLEAVKAQALVAQEEPAPVRHEQLSWGTAEGTRANLEKERDTAIRDREAALERARQDQERLGAMSPVQRVTKRQQRASLEWDRGYQRDRAEHDDQRASRLEGSLSQLERDEREQAAWQSRLAEARRQQGAAIGEQRRREAAQQRAEVTTLRDQDLRVEVESVGRALREPRPEERVRVYSRETELEKVQKELAKQSRECKQRAQLVARDREELDSKSPLARLRRGERTGLKQSLPWSERRLAEDQEKLRELQERRQRLVQDGADRAAWEKRQEQAATRARAVTAELQARQPGRMVELRHAPPAGVIAALGERPEGLRDRVAWQQAASAVEAYGERYGSTGVGQRDSPDPSEIRDRRVLLEQVDEVRHRSESAVGWTVAHEPSVGERVGWVADVEALRAERSRQAKEEAKKAPKKSEGYSYTSYPTQQQQRDMGQKPPSISMGQ